MSFLVPWFAALTVLAAVPIGLHLLGRPRAERRPFAAMAFLMRAQRRTATRNRLRQLLLLLARALVIAVVPLILAKPYLAVRSDLPAGLGVTESAVVIIDDTRSMGYRSGASSWFELGKKRARRIVNGLGQGSEAALLSVAQLSAPPLPELTTDRTALHGALGRLQATRRTGDLGAALRRSVAILGGAHHALRRVYLISDFAAHEFGDGVSAAWPQGGPVLVPVPVSPEAQSSRPNRAIIELRSESAPELGPRSIAVTSVIANFSDSAVHDLRVTFTLDGKTVAAGVVDIPPRGRVEKRFVHRLGPPLGTEAAAERELIHGGWVELGPGDGLGDDDRAYLRIDERRTVEVLLVDGDPRTNPREDEVFFLETALRPAAAEASQFNVHVVTPDAIDARVLAGKDVVYLANVKAPPPERTSALRSFVERGGGLFLALGRNVEPEAWNATFSDVLPQPLATLRTVGPTRDAREDGEMVPGGTGERIARFARNHPVLEPFSLRSGGADEALRETRVSRFALLQPTARGAGDERPVLLRLESGAPLLVEGKYGRGRVLLLCTTLDRDWSDLAIQPVFLPLVEQATRYLAGALLRTNQAPVVVGTPRVLALDEGSARLEVQVPAGARVRFGPDRIAGRKRFEFQSTDEPGFYEVFVGRADETPRAQKTLDFVANVDPRESDLAPISPERLASLVHPAGGPATANAAVAPKRRLELWHGLGLGLLVLLALESVLTLRRR